MLGAPRILDDQAKQGQYAYKPESPAGRLTLVAAGTRPQVALPATEGNALPALVMCTVSDTKTPIQPEPLPQRQPKATVSVLTHLDQYQ